MWIPPSFFGPPAANFPWITDSTKASNKIQKSSRVFDSIMCMIWLVLGSGLVTNTNLSGANSRVPMGLFCGGSQSNYWSQGVYDPKHFPERTKEPHASRHYHLQTCVCTSTVAVETGNMQKPAGFPAHSTGPLFPRFPPPNIKHWRQTDVMN